ncbi:MAG TPA: hypothetical protein VFL47_08640 [Flavisolibacter sp.]|nr:hypothetical protein [Flavisolibacter sp.]
MAKKNNTDTGKPSGNRPQEGTGIPQVINDQTRPQDERLTDRFTKDDKEIAEGVRTADQNRNVNKEE